MSADESPSPSSADSASDASHDAPQPGDAPPPAPLRPGPGPRRPGLRALTVIAVLVLVLAGASAWGMDHVAASKEKHAVPPSLSAVIDLSDLGDSLAAEPVGADGSLTLDVGSTRVLRIAGSGGEALVALDPGSETGRPVWQVPVPDELVGQPLSCTPGQQTLDCGEHLSIDPTAGVNRATRAGTLSASGPGAADVPGRLAGGGDRGSSAGLTDRSRRSPSSPQPSASASAAPDQAASPTAASSVRLGESASADSPLAVGQDGAVTVDGSVVEGLTLTGAAPVWATRINVPRAIAGLSLPSTREVWILSDGTTLAGIDGGKLAWSAPVPEGATGLNDLGTQTPPRWLAADGALVMAQSDALRAIDPSNGETFWQASGPVTSWAASGDTIITFNGSTASLLSFDGGSQTASALPSTPPSSSGPQAPSPEDLRGSALELPELCAPAASGEGGAKARFIDGVATGEDPGTGIPPTATMKALKPGVFNGSPVMISVLECNSGGNTVFDMLAVYGTDKALVGVIDPVTGDDVGRTPNLTIAGLRSVGNTIVLTLPNIKVMGDSDCQACRGSATATLTSQWNGDSLETADILYSLPSGRTRPPDIEQVQATYDAIATDDPSADDVLEPRARQTLNSRLGGDQAPENTVRALQFPTGGRVVGCALAGPGGTPQVVTGDVSRITPSGLQPDTFLCPVTTDDPSKPWLHPQRDGFGQETYASWLVLRADERGAYKVVDIGRAFG